MDDDEQKEEEEEKKKPHLALAHSNYLTFCYFLFVLL